MRLVIAGVTGSIGTQALSILDRIDEVEVVGLSAGSGAAALFEAAQQTGCRLVSLAEEASSPSDVPVGVELRTGPDAAADMVRACEPDVVLNAVVGFAGLAVSVAALESGARLALANKESLVAGGDLVTALAEASGAEIIPVDSEHASLAQLLEGVAPEAVESVTITASGGPFRGWAGQQLSGVSVDEALAHPTWSMGGKISIDSATLMNKGLEVIEAHHLFGIDYDVIKVLVHPQSIVHALVTLIDGMSLAHLGTPDMTSPIAWALAHPVRPALTIPRLDLASVSTLEFEAPDHANFPALGLAIEAGRAGGTAPAVLNAANEIAVDAFLRGKIGFREISSTVAATLEGVSTGRAFDFDTIREADSGARHFAAAFVESFSA